MNRIYISLGHLPGADPGAVARDENGKQIMEIERIASAAALIMSKRDTLFKDVELIQVPWVTLNGRIQWINNHLAQYPLKDRQAIALAVEIHYNSGSVQRAQRDTHAIQLWYGSEDGRKISSGAFDNIASLLTAQGPSGGIFHHTENRLGKLGFIAYTKPIAILAELGFVAWEGPHLTKKVDVLFSSIINEMKKISDPSI